jgi:hypothetical protein
MYGNGPIIRPKKTHIDEFNRLCHYGFPAYDSPCIAPQMQRTNASADLQLVRPSTSAENQIENLESLAQQRLRLTERLKLFRMEILNIQSSHLTC